MGALVLGPWIVFNLHAVRGDHHDDQRHRARALGGQLRRGLVRQLHRLLRELLPGSVAEPTSSTSRNVTWCRASRPSSTQGPHQARCRWWWPRASDACGACSSRARPPRSTGGSRAAAAPRVVDRAVRVLRARAVRDRRLGGDAPPEGAHPARSSRSSPSPRSRPRITFGVTRYRAPAEVALVLAAAIGAGAVWTNWRTRRENAAPHRRRSRPPA